MKKYEISEELIRALLAYLLERPYKEVAEGVAALQRLKEIKNEADVD